MSIDIMKVPLQPFDGEAFSYATLLDSDIVSQAIKMGLTTKFYKKVLGDIVDFTEISNCPMDAANVTFWEIMIKSMERWSSFRVETISTKYMLLRVGMDKNVFQSWDEEYQKIYLQNTLQNILPEQQYALFMNMPMPIVDSLKWTFPWKAIYVYSYRVANYLDFAMQNPELIRNQFQEEHHRALEALQVIKEILWPDWVPIRITRKEYVLFGVGLGAERFYGVTENDWNYNFYIAAYVLERILDLANDYFHFEREDSNDF